MIRYVYCRNLSRVESVVSYLSEFIRNFIAVISSFIILLNLFGRLHVLVIGNFVIVVWLSVILRKVRFRLFTAAINGKIQCLITS